MNARMSFLEMLIPLGFFLAGWLLIAGCTREGRGFALPEGNIEAGKVTFTTLGCNDCHSIADIEWKGNDSDLNVSLGGEIAKVKTYGELVTSVINPSHKISQRFRQETADSEGKSKMRNYNEVMTVQQLVDIVTFLQSEYKIVTPPTHYNPYYY